MSCWQSQQVDNANSPKCACLISDTYQEPGATAITLSHCLLRWPQQASFGEFCRTLPVRLAQDDRQDDLAGTDTRYCLALLNHSAVTCRIPSWQVVGFSLKRQMAPIRGPVGLFTSFVLLVIVRCCVIGNESRLGPSWLWQPY